MFRALHGQTAELNPSTQQLSPWRLQAKNLSKFQKPAIKPEQSSLFKLLLLVSGTTSFVCLCDVYDEWLSFKVSLPWKWSTLWLVSEKGAREINIYLLTENEAPCCKWTLVHFTTVWMQTDSKKGRRGCGEAGLLKEWKPSRVLGCVLSGGRSVQAENNGVHDQRESRKRQMLHQPKDVTCKIWAWRLNWLLIIILNSTSKQPFALSPIEIQTLESSAGLETIMNGNVKSTCLHEWSFYRFRGKGWENVITSCLLVNIYPSSRRLIRPFSSNVGGRLAARKNVTAASPLQTLSCKSEMLKTLHLAHSVVALWDMWPFNGRAFCTHSSKTVIKTCVATPKRFEHLQRAFRRTFHCKPLLERSFSPQQTGSTFNASVFSFY